jgi:peptidoglycan/LPS O-acetylase OafA/YrhL
VRRIVPPFYFALLCTAAIDFAIRAINPAFANPRTGDHIADDILVQHLGWHTFGANLLFLQSLTKYAPFGNDSPAWSLAWEFHLYWLYIVFYAMRRRAGINASMLAVVGVSAVSLFMGEHRHAHFWLLQVLGYWLCWCIGAWGAEMYVRKNAAVSNAANPVAIIVAGVVWLASVMIHRVPTGLSDTFGAIPCVLLVLASVKAYERRPAEVSGKKWFGALSETGKFSYSLYLIHAPVLCLLWALWYQRFHAAPTEPLPFLAGIAISIAVGWVSYQLVEKRFVNH